MVDEVEGGLGEEISGEGAFCADETGTEVV